MIYEKIVTQYVTLLKDEHNWLQLIQELLTINGFSMWFLKLYFFITIITHSVIRKISDTIKNHFHENPSLFFYTIRTLQITINVSSYAIFMKCVHPSFVRVAHARVELSRTTFNQ